jgi:hypothetical protein
LHINFSGEGVRFRGWWETKEVLRGVLSNSRRKEDGDVY